MSDTLFSLPLDDDEPARLAIRTHLDDTLFVEAGAGSGKTSSLVERVVALVESGVPVREIAAITFTEKAAGELRDRIRRELERRAATSPSCRAALDELDSAAISTLHGFAQRILTEHPVEAGLPPRVEVLDEISSQVAFDERWEAFTDRLLDDPALERPLLLGVALGVDLDKLRDVARQFGANWDLVQERVPLDHPDPEVLDVTSLCKQLEELTGLADLCRKDDDKLLGELAEIADYSGALRGAPDEEAALALLAARKPTFKASYGQKGNWPDIAGVKAAVVEAGERRAELRRDLQDACLRRLASEIARFTLEAAEERRRSGRLEFHDLLVQARAVLRDPEHGVAVRTALRSRYRRLLLDEFQDTDPIQVELAVLIASADPDAAALPWSKVEVEPGALFFVGDPKQSIYRFRRADISLFLEAASTFCQTPLQLTRNFRTVRPVVDWINTAFAHLIRHEPGSQPDYVALDATRAAAPAGPPVLLLGGEHGDKPNADGLRAREAADVVDAVRTALDDGWSVGDEHAEGGWRPARLGDICILLPARTSLPALERALEEAGIAYRAETSSLVYGTREVRDLLAVARAVDDPTDALALVTALRSPAFGCGDDDLYTFHAVHGGRWDHQRPLPEGLPADHPVGHGITWLKALHDERLWLGPSEVLDRIVRDRRLLELGFAGGRHRDVWRRLRFVVDQARAWEEAEGGTLRQFLAWVTRQSAETSRVPETILPETDDDSVRIMTIHGAKGLEFPITILSGMTTAAGGRRRGVQVLFPPDGGYELAFSSDVQTAEFEVRVPLDEQMDHHEKLRLLYVAATRARDHLVVSVHRATRASEPDSPTKLTWAELLWRAGGDDGAVQVGLPETSAARLPLANAEPAAPTPLPNMATWRAELESALAKGGVDPRAVFKPTIATRQAVRAADEELSPDPGLDKDRRDLDLPPWVKGQTGAAIGRAVHAVLQTADLRTGDGIDEAAAAQAAAEGVLGKDDVIARLARAALESSVVQEAVEHDHWREMYVATPVGDTLVEGYLDLLYRTDDGLVVVDYKTDAVGSDAELDAKLDRYRLQGATYALAVEQATGERVARCVFVFLSPTGAREREVADLPAAVEQVRRSVATWTSP